MGGDYTRYSFDPWDDFSSVFMQQGRVQLDSEWNELIDILNRRLQAETMDIIGKCVVPRETPDGFKITPGPGSDLTIGRGRMYVHGLLAENHGSGDLEFDRYLGEERGKDALLYSDQPYFPTASTVAPLPTGGPHLVYLDVWKREVTHLEDPDLVEKAVGVDTTTRLQTVWQVKIHKNIGSNVTCASPPNQIQNWEALTAPSDGRLTTEDVGVPKSTDPCILSPTGGYRGTENRLYRVEVHKGGALGTASFKWSRDNASIGAPVTGINTSRDQITVGSLGKDSIRRFKKGDWIEITDDWREFEGDPGEMRKIAEDPDEVKRTLKLNSPLPVGSFDATVAKRHTRVRRWDQSGIVRTSTGTTHQNLDDATSKGVIVTPGTSTVSLVLEDGIAVTFSTAAASGKFHSGDYWLFTARTADGSVEELKEAPPLGIHHHYCRLAIVTFPNKVTDCRTLWPPEIPKPGKGCECTVCVTSESHNKGTLTIQQAIDKVKLFGGKVCLAPGLYIVRSPITVNGGHAIQIVGKGPNTILVYQGNGYTFDLTNSLDLTLEKLAIVSDGLGVSANLCIGLKLRECVLLTSGTGATEAVSVWLQNAAGIRVERCIVFHTGKTPTGDSLAAIGFEGLILESRLQENILLAPTGVTSLATSASQGNVSSGNGRYLVTARFFAENNFIYSELCGIDLDGFSFHFADSRIAGNMIIGPTEAGILLNGAVLSQLLPGSAMDVDHNFVIPKRTGNGIIVGVDDARVTNNQIGAVIKESSGHGIVFQPGLLTSGFDPKKKASEMKGIEGCQVIGNRVSGMGGHGIFIGRRTHINSAMIKQNIIERVGKGGIVMEYESLAKIFFNQNLKVVDFSGQVQVFENSADKLSIENNDIISTGLDTGGSDPVPGVWLNRVDHATIAHNRIFNVGDGTAVNRACVGVAVFNSSTPWIAGNEINDVGPIDGQLGCVGILVAGLFDHLDVIDNIIQHRRTRPEELISPHWTALMVGGEKPQEIKEFELPRDGQSAEVRGNIMEAYGSRPAVVMQISGPNLFLGNRCFGPFTSRVPIVRIEAGTAIASNNYLEGPKQQENASFIMELLVPRELVTVLGNIGSGPIEVDHAAISSPWAALNVIAI
ncbi:MAG: hypothetical protein GTO18_18855 [Anaerolineales bacterium]|nr:hypothetical protein [Anaerolineales bacterium]